MHKENGQAFDACPSLLLLLDFVNRNLLAILAQTLETNLAVYQSEEGIVASDPNVGAGMNVGAPLANKDVSGENELTVGALHAKTLGLGVTTVFGGADALFMCKKLHADLKHWYPFPFRLQSGNISVCDFNMTLVILLEKLELKLQRLQKDQSGLAAGILRQQEE